MRQYLGSIFSPSPLIKIPSLKNNNNNVNNERKVDSEPPSRSSEAQPLERASSLR